MKKNEFLEWFDNQELNLYGYKVIVSNQLISKENTSPSPDDRTGVIRNWYMNQIVKIQFLII